METVIVAGATVIVKGLADITIEQIKGYIKRRQERKQEQNLEGRSR